jgi:hypothetical protein
VLLLLLLQAFSWWGALSGLLWGVSIMGRIASIQILGLCLASAIAETLLLVTACIYDAAFNHDTFLCWPLGGAGLALLGLALTSVYVLHAQAAARHKLLAQVAQLRGDSVLQHTAAAHHVEADGHSLETPLLDGCGGGGATTQQQGAHTVCTMPSPQQQGAGRGGPPAAAAGVAPLVLGLGEADPWEVVAVGVGAAMVAGIAAGELLG